MSVKLWTPCFLLNVGLIISFHFRSTLRVNLQDLLKIKALQDQACCKKKHVSLR